MNELVEPPEGENTDAEYIEWLLNPNGGGYKVAIPIGDGRWVGIMPLMFHYTMHVGRLEDRPGHDDKYCYRTFKIAVDSLVEWSYRGFRDEPLEWHQHPATGRRRPDGNASKEYKAS
jgi:hypothetical protein